MLRFILTVGLITALGSCADHSKNELAVYRALNFSLLSSNKAILNSSEILYRSIEEKLSRREMMEKAMIWSPKALQIKAYTKTICDQINLLKEELSARAGTHTEGGKETARENNITTVNLFFGENERVEKLYAALVRYRANVLSIDEQIKINFERTLPIDTTMTGKDIRETYFTDVPVIGALAMLNRFENATRITENQALTFCHNQISSIGFSHAFEYSIKALVHQSSSYLQPGETLEINAGVGTFFPQAEPVVTINNRNVTLDDEGLALYKIKVGQPGKYRIPVKLTFYRPDGTTETATKEVEYTVAEQ